MMRRLLTRSRLAIAFVAAFVVTAGTVGIAQASEPGYDFRATGMWKFTPGADTPYVLKTSGALVGRGGATNVHIAVKEYQRLLNDRWHIPTIADGIYGPGTARSVATFQQATAPTAQALGIDLGRLGDLNANVAYLLVRPVIDEAAATSGIRPGLLSCHAMLEGGFNIGAVMKNAGDGLGAYDLGPVQFSVSHNPGIAIPDMFDPELAYKAMADADAGRFKQFKGNELAAVYAWNSPTDAVRVAKGNVPSAKGQRYVAWMQNCLTTVYGR